LQETGRCGKLTERGGFVDNETILQGVLTEFAALNAIPRPSGQEEAVSQYLLETLREMGFQPERDQKWNVRCDIPGTEGESGKPLILQAHSDMVFVGCEDPTTTPVRTVQRDGWLCSDGRTSLGADCGIGLAAALYLLRAEVPHGPLRLLITADEERGLSGARQIPADCLTDGAGLINLDGFHFGKLLISSAGGLRQRFSKTPEVFFPMLDSPVTITISGLVGGHSGDDIGLGRANAAQLMVWLLQSLDIPYELAGVHCGDAYNAIPTQAWAHLVLDSRDQATLEQRIRDFLEDTKGLYGDGEPGMEIAAAEAEMPQWVLTVDQRDDLLALAGLITCGPITMHPLCPECVGGSGTMGRLYADTEKLEIYSFLRNCQEDQMDLYGQFYENSAQGFGFETSNSRYGAWPGVLTDPLTDRFLAAGQRLGIPLEKTAAHVGLEVSIFHQLAPELPMVSVGMEIQDAHAVTERVRLDSIVPFVRLLADVIGQREDRT
jgi:dipeptidase D